MQELQHNLVDRFRWFRLGLISATVMTPLVSRWQTLRAAERARALWESSRAPMNLPWAHQSDEAHDLPPLARKSNLSAGIWLAGVLVGLFAAGTATYVLTRRRQQSAGGLLELPRAHSNGNGTHLAGQARQILGRSPHTTGTPRRLEDSSSATGAAIAAAPATGTATEEQHTPAGAAATLASDSPEGVAAPDTAPIIGNMRTKVYHEASDTDLPAEENRVYFASAQEAEARGYRADRGDTTRTES